MYRIYKEYCTNHYTFTPVMKKMFENVSNYEFNLGFFHQKKSMIYVRIIEKYFI